MTSEEAFILRVQNAFNYGEEQSYFDVLEEAFSISPNAALLVLYEITMADPLPVDLRHRLLSVFRKRATDELLEAALPVAGDILEKGETEKALAEHLLNVCETRPGSYFALHLAFFSCADDDIAFRCEIIKERWDRDEKA